MTARTPLWWDADTLYFGTESRLCPEREVNDLEASLRGKLEAAGWSRTACEAVGQQLWRWLHGTGQWLRPGPNARPAGQPWRMEVGGGLPELVHLPWELLHDDKGFLAARTPAFMPLRRIDDPRLDLREGAAPKYGLAVLFMAAAPPTQNPLHFEEEERRILTAVPEGGDIRLEVEESGTLDGLAERCGMLADWSVVHLSCHGRASPPSLALETDEGGEHAADPDAILSPIQSSAPRLLVVSACSSGQFCAEPKVRASLADRLVQGGCAAVLAFGTKVGDSEAIAFAGELYRSLSQATRLDLALASLRLARAASGDGDARTWASLRLFTQTEPGPLVAPTATRSHRPGAQPLDGFKALSGAGRTMPIAHPMRFVGRRRELQRALKALRAGPGVVLQGVGGVGKSSIAGRLLSRMTGYRSVTLIGKVDQTMLVRALRDAWKAVVTVQGLLHDDQIRAIGNDDVGLTTLVASVLECSEVRDHPALFVFDDAEKNLEIDPVRPGEYRVRAEAERCYRAVLRALATPGTRSRALVTTRTAVVLAERPGEVLARLQEVPIGSPSAQDQEKLLRRADRYNDAGEPRTTGAGGRVAMGTTPEARQALALTGANPRLFALVHRIWSEDSARGVALLDEIDAYLRDGKEPTDPEVVEDLMARALDTLLGVAGAAARGLLAVLSRVEVPVPLEAVRAALSLDTGEVERWVRLGVVERDLDGDVMVPALLRPRLPAATEAEGTSVRAAAWQALGPGWKVGTGGVWRGTAEQAYFVAKGCVEVGAAPGARERAAVGVAVPWLVAQQRTGETRALSELARSAGQEVSLAREFALAWGATDGEEAGRYLALAEGAMVDKAASQSGAAVLAAKGDAHARQGRLDEAIVAYREAQTMLAEAEGIEPDVRLQQVVVIQGKIAVILMARGDLDEALGTLRAEVIPVFERLGDVRSLAVAQGGIADILMARGDLDEALRIRREDQMPVYSRLGDVRELAMTQGKIGDILMARGDLDEALRIRLEEEVPVYSRLGDVRELAMTQGRIADILMARGDLDEALRIRLEEEIPVHRRLGDVREIAVVQSKIADILMARGDLDEALRVLRADLIPVFERLGDVRSLAMTQGKIADILTARGDLNEALRIRREEIPVFERLGDVRALVVACTNLAVTLLQLPDLNRERAREITTLLTRAYRDAVRLRIPEADQIRALATRLGLSLPDAQA